MRPNIRQKADTLLLHLRLCFVHMVFPVACMKPVPVKIKHFSMIAAAALMLMPLASPVQAGEIKAGGHIVLASLKGSIPSDRTHQPRLFGAGEQRYGDISAFTKWTGVLARFKKDFPKSLNKPHVQDWMKFLASLKNKSKAEQIDAVNAYMNKVRFVADDKNYRTNDYWATPMEFLGRGGDCEDYAFAKYVSLRALGFSQDDMRMAIVYDREMRMPHALLVVYHDDDAKILDNQAPDVRVADDINRYKPIYSISQVAWFRH